MLGKRLGVKAPGGACPVGSKIGGGEAWECPQEVLVPVSGVPSGGGSVPGVTSSAWSNPGYSSP
jgi:hypothetical protein